MESNLNLCNRSAAKLNKLVGYEKFKTFTNVDKSKLTNDPDHFVPCPNDWLYIEKCGIWYPVKNIYFC